MKKHNTALFTLIIYGTIFCAAIAQESSPALQPRNKIDHIVFASLSKQNILPADPVSDSVFLRRVYIDLTGEIPAHNVVRSFLKNKVPNKRIKVINNLIGSEAFADYWTMKWCDLLRVKAEFPINMWPNGVNAYSRWIYDSVKGNIPYDEFARKLLTSSGSNFRVAPVNFYRGLQGEKPSDIAAAAALTFMGTRLDKWPEAKRKDLEVFFSRIQQKGTAEWKEIIVSLDPTADTPLKAVFPDGKKVTIKVGEDPRVVFADWLISEDNEWFARSIANRVWFWFFGYGLIHEPDDIRADSKAVHPELLAYLEKELIKSNYDLQHLFKLIVNSAVYQQSSILKSAQPDGVELFAHYPVRRLDAEVLLDALCKLSGVSDEYMSMIPEPFTFIPKNNKSVELVDGSITSKFLKMFGRPARDTGLESERSNEPTENQRLHLLNSTHVQTKIQKSWKLRQLAKRGRGKGQEMDVIYLAVLSRFPTDEERIQAEGYVKKSGKSAGYMDLFWALVNSKEFLYRH